MRANKRTWKLLCYLAAGDPEGEKHISLRNVGPKTIALAVELGWIYRFQKPGWQRPGDYWYWKLTEVGVRVQRESASRGRKYPELV